MSECVRNTIVNELKGNATSYIINKDKTEIFIPARKFGKDSAYRIAESMIKKANRIFNSKLFGSSVSLNTTYTDGTAVNIQPTKELIESYEVKGKSKSVDKLISDNRLDFFNGDVALYEQEQEELAYIEEENTDNEEFIDENDVSSMEENNKINNKIQELINSGEIITFCE